MFDDAMILAPTLGVLTRPIGHPAYDFDLRKFVRVRSAFHPPSSPPMLLRIGPVEDYAAVLREVEEGGFRLVQDDDAHALAAELPRWYPLVADLTARSVWFTEPPHAATVEATLGWPVFVKGARQTNRHQAALSIAKDADAFAQIMTAWRTDPILHWQPVVCRELLPLQRVGTPRPGELPPAVELRCFLWKGRVVGHGRYWTHVSYEVSGQDLADALALASEVGRRVPVPFLVVDVARTQAGRWVVIECNDAQESGYAGVAAVSMWQAIQDIEG
jgi:hypothetical protein